ncbi:type II secretion system F family protein [Thiocystis violacea]|uniref:type II secretion system F family protein n=1 Tax=Thiocystis violacea TaxID=13725 RepID=UPI0019052508|nr:type II secretion system F family protein [Thiocystis violacea]MBK1719247.1 secretion system protein [Thiocystis violacea]
MSDQSIFILMIFVIGFLMTQSFVRPLMGSDSQARKRLRERIRNLSLDPQASQHVSLVRERYLKDLTPFELKLLSLPGMDRLQMLIDQAGSSQFPHRVAFTSLGLAVTVGATLGLAFGWGIGALLLGLIAGATPILLLRRQRAQRLARFEEQLPEALTIAARALRAGLPFTESLNLVSQEMKAPAGTEFGIVFTEINYGGDPRAALLGLLERVPSVAVMAMVTSVLVQRDTGGNLAELLGKLSDMVRSRFRFQRTLRTLTAEGRMAAWILVLLPFALAGVLTLVNPEFIPMLTEDPTGRELIMWAFGFMMLGVFWMRRIVNIDV